ncbi:NADPH-dependent F420 reductase [Micromonospora sp. NPDC003776]
MLLSTVTDLPGVQTIGIIGRGRMGTMLARSFAARGLRVLTGGRRAPESSSPEDPGTGSPIQHTSIHAVVADADVVVLALPFSAALQMAQAGRLGPGRGRPLIDATNPCFDDAAQLPPGSSGGALVASLLPDWRTVKAFNTVPAAMLAEPMIGARPVTVPIAGDDDAVKEVAARLVRLLGFEPADAGGTAQAGGLEALAALLDAISRRHGLAGRVGFQLARPAAAIGAPRSRDGLSPSPMR